MPENKVRMKAAQVNEFMRISESLIGPLLRRKHAEADVVWVAWRAHVKYFKSMTAHTFTLADVKRLDTEIKEEKLRRKQFSTCERDRRTSHESANQAMNASI